ncbi:uncharacterized protein [Thunnus thynnus]|uniref:uncharacterized protein isoform X2 n=1 Tax=Thunnus thynnus TaxID=8237 RepID=UPI003528528D
MNTLVENDRRFLNHGFTSPAADIKYYGLMNQGATCYLNSVLQVLFMTKEFKEAVERHTSENPDTECFELHLKNLFEDLKRYNPVYTFNITKKLGIKNVFEQRDAAEYFEKILSLMSSKAMQIFHGELTHTIKCSECRTETNTDGPFWHLPLALVDSSSEDYSVVDGIEKFFSTSEVSGENQMYCEKCDDKADATFKSLMTHHPDVLMLQLKRFEFDYRYMAYVKINHFVNIPFTLQIPENQIYELYAVVDHFGNLRSGHYTATIKSDDNDIWYKFDDARVSRLDYQPFQVDNAERSQTAHLLFYRKKKTDAADTCTQDTREMSTSEGLPMDISDNVEQLQDAVKIRENHEGGEKVEVSNDTAEAVSIDRYEEKESRDMHSFGSRQVKMMRVEEEDMGGKTGADDQAKKRKVFSVETHTDQNVGDQSNYNGGLDDVTQKISQEHVEGDVRQNIPYISDFKQDVSGGHGYFNKQDDMSNTQMTEEDGKTGDSQSKKRKSSIKYLNKNDKEYEDNVHICQNIYEDQEGKQKQYYDLEPVGVDTQGEEERMEINVKGNKERKTGDDESASGSVTLLYVLRSEDFNNRRDSDGKQNMPKDNQGISNTFCKRHQQQREQKRGDNEQRVGPSQKQQHFSQGVEYPNNVKQEISVTTHKDVGMEKQAKEQNENIQNREDSSSRQAGLAGRGRLTENQRVGSDEKARHVNSQPNARSGLREDTMDVKDGTKQKKILLK